MANDRAKGGPPLSSAKARRPLAAFTEMRRRYGAIDDVLAELITGVLPHVDLQERLDLILSDAEVADSYYPGDGTVAAEEAVRLAQALQRVSIARGALAAHEGRLIDVEAGLLNALIGADLERRIVPAYMAEFVALLQASGIIQGHVRDLSRSKLNKILAVLAVDDDDLGAAEVTATKDEVGPTERLGGGLWDDIEVSGLQYQIVEREPTREELQASLMRLPPVATARELGVAGPRTATVLKNIEEYADFGLMIDYHLPAWEKQEGVTLTPEERRLWAFLMVSVAYPAKSIAEDRRNFFAGIIFPGPEGSSTIRELRLRASSPPN